MAKIGSIDYNNEIIKALKGNKLVIFAGAGISMGSPSGLPGFKELAEGIAKSTHMEVSNPYDRFLGSLDFSGINVHGIAAKILNLKKDSKPTELHKDVLRLFRFGNHVRIVTTNFDNHFETAAKDLFGEELQSFCSSVLPSGNDFLGIVHLHGSTKSPQKMILTDSDFGFAYLVDGWASRFLIDLFQEFTVLFVGYSYGDVVMHYLRRALQKDSLKKQYILTDEDKNWDLLGLEPIRFTRRNGPDEYEELNYSVHLLADRINRGVLDWGTRLTEICKEAPPTDKETADEIAEALSELHTTRLLTKTINSKEWLVWMNANNYLDALFSYEDLGEIEYCLAIWLVENFCDQCSGTFFDILAMHNMQLNPRLWERIVFAIAGAQYSTIDASFLERWIAIILSNKPKKHDLGLLLGVTELCARKNEICLILRIFLSISEYSLSIKHKYYSKNDSSFEIECIIYADHYVLNKIWIDFLKQNMPHIYRDLLFGVYRQITKMHQDYKSWGKATSDLDPVSIRRPAIEANEQNRFPGPNDVLIDAARDALEWLSKESPTQLDFWAEEFVKSDAPVLRRLAIHVMANHSKKTESERLKWLMDNVGLFGHMETHETHRLVLLNYAQANEDIQKIIVETVLKKEEPAMRDWSAETMTDRLHYDWFSWLQKAKPDCKIAGNEIAVISKRHPDWKPTDHQYFYLWTTTLQCDDREVPWSKKELLENEPNKIIDSFLALKQQASYNINFDGLLALIMDICIGQTDWSLALAKALCDKQIWSSELWTVIIQSWAEAGLSTQDQQNVLMVASSTELYEEHAHEIAVLLNYLTRDRDKSLAIELLDQANPIAMAIWQNEISDDKNVDNWLFEAINNTSGHIVEFWLNSMSLFLHSDVQPNKGILSDYLKRFEELIKESKSKGGYCRCLLARRLADLFEIDEKWTLSNIVPLFIDSDHNIFCQIWEGFLTNVHMFRSLGDILEHSIERIKDLPKEYQELFVYVLTIYFINYSDDPTLELLPRFLISGTSDNKMVFYSHFASILQHMESTKKKQLWRNWLYTFFEDRLQAVPIALTDTEVIGILELLPYLGESFTEAVSLAVRLPCVPIEKTSLLHSLNDCELPAKYPEDVAALMIYLCSCKINSLHCYDLIKLKKAISITDQNLLRKLNEGLVRIGAI